MIIVCVSFCRSLVMIRYKHDCTIIFTASLKFTTFMDLLILVLCSCMIVILLIRMCELKLLGSIIGILIWPWKYVGWKQTWNWLNSYKHNCKKSTEILQWLLIVMGARGGAVGWGTALQAGRSRVPFPMVSFDFFLYNPSGLAVALG